MKRIVCSMITVFLLASMALAYNGNVIVCITRTGECYHRDNCSYLHSKIEITLKEAVEQGYRRCSRCRPPTLGEDQDTDKDPYMTAAEKRDTEKEEQTRQEQLARAMENAETSRQEAEATRQDLADLKQRIFYDRLLLLFVGLPVFLAFSSFRVRRARRRAAEVAVGTIRQELDLQQREIQSSCQQSTVYIQESPGQPSLPLPPRSLMNTEDTISLRAAYQELYGGKSIRELTGVPADVWFDENDYPHSRKKAVESSFTVYITPSGKSYHLAKCSSARNGRPVHICWAKMHGKGPCDRCGPLRDIPQWAKEYQRITWICRKFGIETLP